MLENFRTMKNTAMQHLPLPNHFRDENCRPKITYHVTVTVSFLALSKADTDNQTVPFFFKYI